METDNYINKNCVKKDVSKQFAHKSYVVFLKLETFLWQIITEKTDYNKTC